MAPPRPRRYPVTDRPYPAARRAKRTLFEQRETGVFPHHANRCPAKGWDAEGVCGCSPTFQPQVWDTKTKRPIKGPKFPTIAAAKSWLVDARHDKKRGTLRPPTALTFNEAADAWLEGAKADPPTVLNRNRRPYKPSVLRGYEAILDARLRPHFGTHKLSDIRHVDAQDYVDELIAEGLGGQTVDNLTMPARVIFRRARKRGDVEHNPFDGVEVPASDGKRDLVASPKEAAALIEALEDLFDRALWALWFYAGPRCGEAQDLHVPDVGDDSISVDSSWDKIAGSVAPKSAAGVRLIPKCEHLSRYLDPYVESLGRDSGFLFPGDTPTEPFNYGKTTRAAYKAWQDAGLGRFTPHNARHSFRSYLDAIPAISDTRADAYMGHADHSMRARYTHSIDGQLALDAAALDEWLSAHESGNVVQIRQAS
jgi:integrase